MVGCFVFSLRWMLFVCIRLMAELNAIIKGLSFLSTAILRRGGTSAKFLTGKIWNGSMKENKKTDSKQLRPF
jgi:hypothetical protein